MKRGVESLKSGAAPETTFFCLSNANVVFIRLILEHHNLGSLFNEVVSNPAEWTPEGCLVIRRRVPPEGVQHGCDAKPRACSANMCKGKLVFSKFDLRFTHHNFGSYREGAGCVYPAEGRVAGV